MKSLKKRLLALLLTATMVLGLCAGVTPVRAVNETGFSYTHLDKSQVTAPLFDGAQVVENQNDTLYAGQTVRATVVLKGETNTLLQTEAATTRRAQQDALVQKFSDEVLDGAKVDVVWHLTLATNALSLNIPYEALAKIRTMEGVKAVFVERRYMPLADAPASTIAQTMTGVDAVRESCGLTGAGTRVAVIDTGTDTDHRSFDNEAYLESLKRLAKAAGVDFDAYLASLNLLSKDKIAAVLEKLNAYQRYQAETGLTLTADDLYYSEKLPFNFNYVDLSLDVTHENDTQGEHGSHVAGIAAANRLVPSSQRDLDFNGDGLLNEDDAKALMAYVVRGQEIVHADLADLSGDGTVSSYDVYLLLSALEGQLEAYTEATPAVGAVGVAPDAQLITMKVFGVNGGAYPSDYIAAAEDAWLLGCDVANLSLGSAFPGFTQARGSEEAEQDAFIQGVLDTLTGSDMVLAVAAGNNGNWADEDGAYQHMYTDEGGTFNTSSPATYTASFAVASADNVGSITDLRTTVDGALLSIIPTSTPGIATWNTLAGEALEVVFVGDPTNLFAGKEQTDMTVYGGDAADFAALGDLTGKVVLIARGNGVTFAAKHSNAAAAGAKAVMLYNNVPGGFGAALDGTTGTVPCVSITFEDAKAIFENGNTTHTMEVETGLFVETGDGKAPAMSDFSSWGTTGALTIKPEITAPGGDIWSVNGAIPGGESYESMSGTSMAAPHVAGLSALAKQYIEMNGLLAKAKAAGADVTVRNMVQSLLMSTAVPLVEGDYPYSVRNQGAGLASMTQLVSAKSMILVDDQPDGKVKAELGDGKEGFSFGFTVYNLSDEELTYTLDSQMLTTATLTVDGHNLVDDAMTALDAAVTMDNTVTVPAGGSKHVTVSIAVTDKAVSDMEKLGYENGFYVEGYLYVKGDDCTHSIPMLGWYGNWTDPSMYDTGSYIDALYGTQERPSHVPSENEVRNILTFAPQGATQGYVYDGNVFSSSDREGNHDGDKRYIEGRNAVNNTDDAMFDLYAIFPTMIRNAAAFKMEFFQHGTDKLYYSENNFDDYYGMPLEASTYYPGQQGWIDVTTSYGLDLTEYHFTDENGDPLPEGAQVDIVLTTAPDYYVHGTTVDWDAVGEGASLRFTFTVDNTAPKLAENGLTMVENTLTVEAVDENYIAAVILLDGTAQRSYAFYYPDSDAKGETVKLDIDMTDYRKLCGDKAVVAIADYAGNVEYYAVNLGGEGAPYGQFLAYQYDVAATSSLFGGTPINGWIAFDENVSKNETSVFASDVDFTCAEYVNGNIFAQAKDGKLYGIPYADMLSNQVDLDATYIATLDTVYNDMAYDYHTGKLLGLCFEQDQWGSTSTVYSINLNGTEDYMEPYQEDWVANRGGFGALGMAVDDAGTIYLLGTSEDDEGNMGNEAELWKAEAEDSGWSVSYRFVLVGKTGLTMDYLQSMTWNHNTEKLCWARFMPTTSFSYESELYELNPETAEATKLGDLSGETAALMAPLTAEAAALEAHQNVPEMDSTVIPTPIFREKNINLNVGGSTELLYDLDPWYASDKAVEWTSSNPDVVSVDSGVVTGLKAGSATVTVCAKGDPEKFDTCTVNVTALTLDFEGIITSQGQGVGMTGGVQTYSYSMVEGTSQGVKGGLKITDPDEWTSGMQLACSVYNPDTNEILVCEYGNSGLVYKIDADTGVVTGMVEPIDGDMVWGMTYSQTSKHYTAVANMDLYVDLPMDETQLDKMLDSYDEENNLFTWHRLSLLEYLIAAGGNFVTGEDGNGASSEIVFCGITQVENTAGEPIYDGDYKNFLGEWDWSAGEMSYIPTSTLVLLDNVGRLWYIDEIRGLSYVEDDWGTQAYVSEDYETMISATAYGVMAVEDDLSEAEGDYIVYYIRSLEETPLTDLFRADKMPRITYHFSDIEYAGTSEDGSKLFLMSLYDYWNNGTTNHLYLLKTGVLTDEMDYETWEPIRLPDQLFELGDTGEYNIIATIHKTNVDMASLAPQETVGPQRFSTARPACLKALGQ